MICNKLLISFDKNQPKKTSLLRSVYLLIFFLKAQNYSDTLFLFSIHNFFYSQFLLVVI